jgi:acetyl esterase/lipase
MDTVRFLGAVSRAWVDCYLRRRREGPERPTWTLPQEAFVAVLREHGRRLLEMSPAEARARTDALQTRIPVRRDVWIQDRRLGGVPGLQISARTPTPDAPVLMYFHGGAYVFGTPTSYAAHLAELAAATGGSVVAPDYRLAPEHRFPAAVEDASRALDALLAQEPPARVVLAGDSAGGALAIASLFHRREERAPMPAGVVVSSPWVDLSAHLSDGHDAEEAWLDSRFVAHFSHLYLGGADPTDPRASPLQGDLSGLPPIRIQVGEAELMCGQVTEFAWRARGCGVDARVTVWPDMIHGFWAIPYFFPSRKAVRQLAGWARQLVSRGNGASGT